MTPGSEMFEGYADAARVRPIPGGDGVRKPVTERGSRSEIDFASFLSHVG